jgi:hypothetical protein
MSVPDLPKCELKGSAEVKKEKQGPPDSALSSYADWKEYQADLKKDKEGKNKVNEEIKKKEAELDEDDPLSQRDSSASQRNLYVQFRREMEELEAMRKQANPAPPPSDSNIMRVDDMFVSGYETVAYEAVLPPLRTNRLVLPGQQEIAEAYPNISKLFLEINLFQQLNEYLSFAGNYSAANLPKQLVSSFRSFCGTLSDEGFKSICSHMSAGIDLSDKAKDDFTQEMFGSGAASELSKKLGDSDWSNYIYYLLKPKVRSLWNDAPGGYAPFYFNSGSKPAFVRPEQVQLDGMDLADVSCLKLDLSSVVREPPSDISEFYRNGAHSPWYPVFRYQGNKDPKFVFLQLIGEYQLIYGRNGVIFPSCNDTMAYNAISLSENVLSRRRKFTLPTKSGEKKQVEKELVAVMNTSVCDELMPAMEGFDLERINRDCAFYFPEKSQSKALREANRVLLITDYDGGKALDGKRVNQPVKDTELGTFYYCCYLFRHLHHALLQALEKCSGTLVKVEDGSEVRLGEKEKMPFLLPIDYSRIGGAGGTLSMGSSFGANNLIDSPTYDAAVTVSVKDGFQGQTAKA